MARRRSDDNAPIDVPELQAHDAPLRVLHALRHPPLFAMCRVVRTPVQLLRRR